MNERELVKKYIEQNPHRPGLDEARVVGFGVPVWALVGHLRGVNDNVDAVARDYDIPREAVLAALAYYRQHKGLIDARIAANETSVA